jgi:hypothetical protein
MRHLAKILLLTGTAGILAACNSAQMPESAAEPEVAAEAPAPLPPFKPVATTAVLMRGTIALAAADYWASVSIVVDSEGEHENFPQDEEEWSRVWASGITLAESGNLLLMAPRALDDPEWTRLSLALVDAGLNAARAAFDEDFMAVLDEGEKVYNVCSECHELFMPNLQL